MKRKYLKRGKLNEKSANKSDKITSFFTRVEQRQVEVEVGFESKLRLENAAGNEDSSGRGREGISVLDKGVGEITSGGREGPRLIGGGGTGRNVKVTYLSLDQEQFMDYGEPNKTGAAE